MLRQHIDALKLAQGFLDMMREKSEGARLGLLDLLILLHVNDHPGCSKSDLTELMMGDRYATKSSLDRPVNRLLDYGLIDAEFNPHGATKAGKPRTAYKISKEGLKFLKKSSI